MNCAVPLGFGSCLFYSFIYGCFVMLQSDGFRGLDFMEGGDLYAGDDNPEDLSIEVDRFFQILNENSDPSSTRHSEVRGVLLIDSVWFSCCGGFWCFDFDV